MRRIADEFARCRGLSRDFPLKRVSSAVLHFLPRKERVRLGPSLFKLSNGVAPEKVILIDDIVTTGTTLRAAVKLLKSAGVRQVYVAVLARQVLDE
jgi:predicted amidophosphoribosyltransferase